MEQYNLGNSHTTGSFSEEDFVQHLTSCGRKLAGAKAAAKSVKYFLGYTKYTQQTTKDIIMNKANIRAYINHLKQVKGYAGTTILERVGWLNTAIDFITDNDNPTIKDHLRVEAIKKLISDIKSTICKTMIKEQRATQARLSAAKVKLHVLETCHT